MGVIPIQEFHLELSPTIRVIGVENPANDNSFEEAGIIENRAFSTFAREVRERVRMSFSRSLGICVLKPWLEGIMDHHTLAIVEPAPTKLLKIIPKHDIAPILCIERGFYGEEGREIRCAIFHPYILGVARTELLKLAFALGTGSINLYIYTPLP